MESKFSLNILLSGSSIILLVNSSKREYRRSYMFKVQWSYFKMTTKFSENIEKFLLPNSKLSSATDMASYTNQQKQCGIWISSIYSPLIKIDIERVHPFFTL